MPKRKKKPTLASQQKMAVAQHRNEFINRLKDILDKAVGPHIFPLITRQEMEVLYEYRHHPVRLKAGPEQDVTSMMLKDAKSFVTLMFKGTLMPDGIGELTEISLYDYFSIGYTVILYAKGLERKEHPHAATILKALTPFVATIGTDFFKDAWRQYNGIMNMVAMIYSDITDNIYAFKFRQDAIEGGALRAGWCNDVYCQPAPKIRVSISGINRPAYRLGWYLPEPALRMEFLNIRSEQVNLPAGKLLDVYVQSHALNRLSERMEGLITGLLHFNLFDSFDNLKVCKNKRGDLLFEYRIFGYKAGYFTGEVVNEQLILTTFLFLTNNGTPEAEKLHANTGLMKEDKEYLSIDKLSAFLSSDIPGNDQVREVFAQAGCESIFDIVKTYYLPQKGTKEKLIAGFIAKYLQLEAPSLPGQPEHPMGGG
jgi:hypothetical protein